MESEIFVPMAKRFRAAAAQLRRTSDGSSDCGEEDPEAKSLSALARRIEGYADALDPTAAKRTRESAEAAQEPNG